MKYEDKLRNRELADFMLHDKKETFLGNMDFVSACVIGALILGSIVLIGLAIIQPVVK